MTTAEPPAEILLVGCGKMGSALLTGWLRSDQVGRVDIVEPHPPEPPLPLSDRVVLHASISTIPPAWRPSVVVFAVKPQVIPEVVPAYSGIVATGALVLSIAAGKTIAGLERLLGPAAVVRAMPNTPAAIGRGITVAVGNDRATRAQKAIAQRLLEAVGRVSWVADERLLDAVTAVSGSGPAYVFLLIETMTAAGIAAGLPAGLAEDLARETVAGSGELARQSPDSAAQLRRNVTSPNGTTEAALRILMADDGMAGLLLRAIDAATRRSRELAG
jgi:pyrroline-5-carboxylate reductase